MKPWPLLLLLIVFASCNQVPSDEEIRSELPGDWVLVNAQKARQQNIKENTERALKPARYIFYPDGTGMGFSLLDSSLNYRMAPPPWQLDLRWKVEHSTLHLYTIDGSVWMESQITRLKKDTIELSSSNDRSLLIRQ